MQVLAIALLFAQPANDDGPWLNRADHERIKKTWPAKVDFPKSLKFYDLPRRYQQMYTMGGGTQRFTISRELEDGSLDFQVSGGMSHIPGHLWSSYKGLAIADGKKIEVWRENTDVRAFSLVPRWRWRFPEGTVAYDALFNADGQAFEIRTMTRLAVGKGWESEIVYKNRAIAPKGFAGAGATCGSCHSQPGNVVDVPGRIYMHTIWGDDGRFSWRPYKDSQGSFPELDRRWPLVER